jgi:hypothetical protein
MRSIEIGAAELTGLLDDLVAVFDRDGEAPAGG